MAYRVIGKRLCASDRVYRPGDVIPDGRYGAAMIGPWLRDHWIEEIEEEVEEVEESTEAKAPSQELICLICGRVYKTTKGFFAHIEAKHPEEL